MSVLEKLFSGGGSGLVHDGERGRGGPRRHIVGHAQLVQVVVELERRTELEAHVLHEHVGGEQEQGFAVDLVVSKHVDVSGKERVAQLAHIAHHLVHRPLASLRQVQINTYTNTQKLDPPNLRKSQILEFLLFESMIFLILAGV